MMIDFQDETGAVADEHIELVEKLLTIAGKAEKVAPDAEVSISFVDNEQIQVINRDYRDKDKPTDVISFAMQEMEEEELEIVGEGLPIVLGDIIISIDKAKEQAEEYNHSFERELAFLALHGFLHLLGYDHMNAEDEKKMFRRQDEILGEFGIER
ncbi:rRNA maturation RNase YbeY [Oceanobacillus neutriphilus]|uniref:Endoribonuclease YbeY n=1 Tax=Oceanobacillus neutriphilus TaxID=531815 RepID=A0ABQ2NWX3_9BACI|nr:rRNA maturation RNase YbeY [Oceanobacillus neutriphilus]GGP12670.1 endoribonuclease YbeY [Oceanobacillus neutriphilus]